MNLYLAGMIGSGKTTLGRRIADRIGRPFYDLDLEMERILGYSFHHLVQSEGWLPFRELEYRICKQFSEISGAVVCLGGGTVRYQWNLDVLAGSGLILLLEVSPDEIIRRVEHADRPRVNPVASLEEDVRLMWERERRKYYAAAEIVYVAEGKPLERETSDIIDILKAESRLKSLFEAA